MNDEATQIEVDADADAEGTSYPEEQEQFPDVEATSENDEGQQRYDITHYPADFTLEGYRDKVVRKKFVVPEWQRSYVWTPKKASRFIESMLMGLPVPGVFLYKKRSGDAMYVVDGQQRILSVVWFLEGLDGHGVLRLTGLNDSFNGLRFADLPEEKQETLRDYVLRATVISQVNPNDDTSIFHIFERLNTGGVNLNPMEVRKAVYWGDYFNWLEQVNANGEWRTLLGKEDSDRRLSDVQLILRVDAMAHSSKAYYKPMKNFLTDHIAEMDRTSDPALLAERRDSYEAAFRSAVASKQDGRPFHLRGRLNYALLDSMLVALLENPVDDHASLQNWYTSLLDDEDFVANCTMNTSDVKVVGERMATASAALRAAT